MTGFNSHAGDINPDGWINTHLPVFFQPYAVLMRLDRPIGTWLLLWPCWWSVALAADNIPNIWLMVLFALGAIIMRGAGCVVNDIYDRHLDREVERTRSRPIANGTLSLWQATIFLTFLLFIGFGVLLMFNHVTVLIGVSSLLLVFIYPLMKRITWWPQLFLGFTFNWGALMGAAAVYGHLTIPAALMYTAGIAWTLGYDTIYACQDINDDARVGIKSTARLFGRHTKWWVGGFYAMAVIVLAMAGWTAQEQWGFYAALAGAGAFSFVNIVVWDVGSPKDCQRRFCSNMLFGGIIFLAILLGKGG